MFVPSNDLENKIYCYIVKYFYAEVSNGHGFSGYLFEDTITYKDVYYVSMEGYETWHIKSIVKLNSYSHCSRLNIDDILRRAKHFSIDLKTAKEYKFDDRTI